MIPTLFKCTWNEIDTKHTINIKGKTIKEKKPNIYFFYGQKHVKLYQ